MREFDSHPRLQTIAKFYRSYCQQSFCGADGLCAMQDEETVHLKSSFSVISQRTAPFASRMF